MAHVVQMNHIRMMPCTAQFAADAGLEVGLHLFRLLLRRLRKLRYLVGGERLAQQFKPGFRLVSHGQTAFCSAMTLKPGIWRVAGLRTSRSASDWIRSVKACRSCFQ